MRLAVQQVIAVVRKDLMVEMRAKDLLIVMLTFAVLSLVIFNLALDLWGPVVREIGPGLLWLTITFAAMLGMGRTFVREHERGTLVGLLLAPIDRGTLFIGKLLANLIFLFIMEAVTLPMFAVLFNLPVLTPSVILITVLGTLGFAILGTMFSAMAALSRAREALLPLLLLPTTVPILIGAVQATGNAISGAEGGPPWISLLIAFDVIFFTLSYLLFAYAVET
jgi:heme exporter protein B